MCGLETCYNLLARDLLPKICMKLYIFMNKDPFKLCGKHGKHIINVQKDDDFTK